MSNAKRALVTAAALSGVATTPGFGAGDVLVVDDGVAPQVRIVGKSNGVLGLTANLLDFDPMPNVGVNGVAAGTGNVDFTLNVTQPGGGAVAEGYTLLVGIVSSAASLTASKAPSAPLTANIVGGALTGVSLLLMVQTDSTGVAVIRVAGTAGDTATVTAMLDSRTVGKDSEVIPV